MPMRYFDYYGRPARVSVDENDVPVRCEVYDAAEGALVPREDLTLDVTASAGSHLITEDQFDALLARQGREKRADL